MDLNFLIKPGKGLGMQLSERVLVYRMQGPGSNLKGSH